MTDVTEPMLMMRPLPCGIISRATDWATKNAPRRLVSRIRFQSSHVTSTAGFRTLHPALFTRMSMRPNAFAASLDHAADAPLVANVELQRKDAASHAFDFLLKRLERIERAAGDGEIGPRPREGSGKRLSESTARAGHDGDFSGQIEWVHEVRFRFGHG